MKTLVISPAIMIPRIDGGMDHSVQPKLIALHKNKRLLWIRGFTGWVSRGQSGYWPGVLQCIEYKDNGSFTGFCDYLQEGGRLSKASLNAVKEKIAEKLEVDIKDLDQLDPKTTLVIGKSTKACQKALEKLPAVRNKWA